MERGGGGRNRQSDRQTGRQTYHLITKLWQILVSHNFSHLHSIFQRVVQSMNSNSFYYKKPKQTAFLTQGLHLLPEVKKGYSPSSVKMKWEAYIWPTKGILVHKGGKKSSSELGVKHHKSKSRTQNLLVTYCTAMTFSSSTLCFHSSLICISI